MHTALPGEELRAPGILQNPVPVEALYDWEVGREVTLRNLLQRHGYENLEACSAPGHSHPAGIGILGGGGAGSSPGTAISFRTVGSARWRRL